MRLRVRSVLLLGIIATFLLPSIAAAQSAITGLVRDTTGAVLPGVTVEASSPVLIEKVRTAVSDEQGRYTIVDLRPGTYNVVFALAGFNTLRHEGLELPANFTATVNADLRVGALEESITVTGDAPVVDVTTTQRTQVMNRELLDAVPSARNNTGLAALMPGVRMSNTDVGGNQQMEQIYMTVHGSRQTDTTMQVDGMNLNSLMNGGQVQAYFSDAANAEISFQTSGAGADVSAGGVRINMIPKEGGNRFSGSAFVGGTDGSWQSDNVTDELRQRGLQSGDRVDHISDYNFALGGPIMRDKLWFFGTWRRIATNEVVANSFYDDGSPAIEDQWIQNQMVRLTWQMTPSNKITAYHDRYPKFKGHELGAFTDPARAAGRRDPEHALYYTGQAKWTSTLTPRLLLETGYSTNIEMLLISFQPGIKKERGTPEWFSTVRHVDRLRGTNTVSGGLENGIYPSKFVVSSMASYVTGSHNFKAGLQWGFGNYRTSYETNGDLYQYYDNGVPSLVLVYNTPVYQRERLNRDMGIFAQDSWTIRRLTVNAGVRFEHFNAEIRDQGVPAGRFVPLREVSRLSDYPNWNDITPRLGLSYDLFGNAKTALKLAANKYMAGQTTDFPARYNPNALQFEFRSWTDRNGDDIAQDTEIGASQNSRFGLPVQTIRPEDDLQREYDWVYNLGIQHEVTRGLGVSANWYRRSSHDMRVTENIALSLNDYTPINIFNPLDGSTFTIYNLNASKFGQVDRIDRTSTDSDLRQRVFNAVELGFNARFGRLSGFGAYTMDRSLSVYCDGSNIGSTLGTTIATDPNTLRFCDERELDIPFRHEIKFAGSYTLPYDVQVNAAFQTYTNVSNAAANPTGARRAQWNLTRTTRYPADCPAPCPAGALVAPNLTLANLEVPLIAPGTQFLPRHNQLDLGIRKLFRVRNIQVSGQFDIFNATNSNLIKTELQTFGPSLFRPSSILQPRTLRLAAQMRF
jgi:hypothetical protein